MPLSNDLDVSACIHMRISLFFGQKSIVQTPVLTKSFCSHALLVNFHIFSNYCSSLASEMSEGVARTKERSQQDNEIKDESCHILPLSTLPLSRIAAED